MKLLVICQYYYPEPFRVNDLCEEMVKRGHEVLVVTGEPNYPEGFIYKEYEHHQKSDEVINGVKVHRCPIVPRKTGSVYRLLNYFSFPSSAKRYVRSKECVSSDGTPFDVVLVNQLSPVMMAEPAITYKNKYHVPALMYCLDLWPVSLVAGGVSKESFIYKVFHGISKRIYTSMDRILVTSRLFHGYLKEEFSISDEIIDYLPQYAEGIFEQLPYREKDGKTNLVFAGNIGVAQSVDTIIDAAEGLVNYPVHFHIVGSGIELDRLQRKTEEKQLQNVTFYGRRPLEEMPKFYAIADAMLVTLQADPVLSLTLPGKVQSYMAVGKPIIGAIDGEAAEIINTSNCGFCGRAEDAQELIRNIVRFVDADNKKEMGNNARSFYEQYFDRDRFMNKLESELQSAVKRK